MQTLTTPETTNLQTEKPGFLTIKNVSKVYNNQKEPDKPFVILDGVNLTVNEGEFICLIGHSGCGKSTLLNMIAGFNGPTSGEVALEGSPITEPGPDRMVVFQNYSLLPWLTATENIHLGVESVYADKSAEEHNAIVKQNLELVGLTEAGNKRPGQLSGGMKQRVAIARALATRPKLLILDEPFGALDPITREELQEELLKIWREHKITVIMITHDIDEALFLADRIVMMTNGPAASIGEDMHIPFSRPRNRTRVMEDPKYYELRNFALEFLFSRYAHHEEEEATDSETETVAIPLPVPAGKKSAVADRPRPEVSFTPHATEPVKASRLKVGILAVSGFVAMATLAAVVSSPPSPAPIAASPAPIAASPAPIAASPAPIAASPAPIAPTSPVATNSPASGISDKTELDAIENQLYAQIDQNWRTTPTFTESLTYRVKVKQNGDILQFDPTNQAAKDFVTETPLPVLQTPAGVVAGDRTTAEFQVTFSPSGVLEVKTAE
ncbi:nitrate ABC transporter ATP-binding protein [Microcoleus sp.]|uniref:nitrate ABC transporter ATP-binding protein n=1 Tax=Microcoleus sp. TaxID=44472 RepID=UPI003C76B599